jgi:hypothetical protein
MKPLFAITVVLLAILASNAYIAITEHKSEDRRERPQQVQAAVYTYTGTGHPAVSVNDIAGIKYGKLIKCLIRYESSGVPWAVGDGGLAYGVLQFHWKTFEGYKKGLGLDYLEYWYPEDQIRLADAMLQADFRNTRHWTTAKKCL